MDEVIGAEPEAGPWPAQWMHGVLELCVLALVAERETYGYAIAQRLEAARLGKVKGGTIYPILLRLEREGLVTSVWRQGEGGPGRKFFQITALGATELAARRLRWSAFNAVTTELLTTTAKEADDGKLH